MEVISLPVTLADLFKKIAQKLLNICFEEKFNCPTLNYSMSALGAEIFDGHFFIYLAHSAASAQAISYSVNVLYKPFLHVMKEAYRKFIVFKSCGELHIFFSARFFF